MESSGKFSGAAKAAAALIGIRIAAGDRQPRTVEMKRERPAWIAELDEQDQDDQLWLALHSPLDQLHEARIAPASESRAGRPLTDRHARRRAVAGLRFTNVRFERRSTCTRARR